MATDFIFTDEKIKFLTLNYATRILVSESDFDKLVPLALETLTEFSGSNHVEILFLDTDEKTGETIGIIDDGEVRRVSEKIDIANTPLDDCITKKQPGRYTTPAGINRLAMPLVGSGSTVIGITLIDFESNVQLSEADLQILIMLSSLIAVSFLQTRYFQLAMFDGLTGLYVRRLFDEKIAEEINRVRRYGGDLSIIMADIDFFKKINDQYGHQVGDKILQESSALLRDDIRDGIDIPCRYGGEEFIVILPNTDIDGAEVVAERFRWHCEQHRFNNQETPVQVTFSLGVTAITKETAAPAKELIRRADEMLYLAKKNGRNQVQVFGKYT